MGRRANSQRRGGNGSAHRCDPAAHGPITARVPHNCDLIRGRTSMHPSSFTSFLFTDIEGSTRLWEETPGRMQRALALHDSIVRSAVQGHRGSVVKMLGDGVIAAFADPLDAIVATLELQQALGCTADTGGIALRVRCAIHVGAAERRDNDYFGTAVNRAARVMGVAHGGQILVSQAVAVLVRDRLPANTTLRDLGSVRLRDLSTPEQIFQVVHGALRSEFPALRSLEAVPNNLPQQVTSFIGRERELAEVKALLATTRLVTLLGVGGLGKTRLSLQTAADAVVEYPDGVWLVELAPLADSELVSQAVASVLGVKEAPGRPVLEALVGYSRDKRLLLILDNCEHVIQACANIAGTLLRAAPDLKIIASSREPLRISGETTYHLPSLSVPGIGDHATTDALLTFEAVRLFADRAAAVQPTFRVTQQNTEAIIQICNRLDGMPLALELAAARVRSLTVEKIAERLGDRFRLLTGGSRTALPRQQTLHALIDWSHNLLSDHERMLLRRLAVFAGGWTLEAAEMVGAGGEVREPMVLDLLTQLVEKSLVVLSAEGGRYRLLDTVREFAQDRLVESGETAATREKHFIFCLDLVERARSELKGSLQAAALVRIDADRENLLAAHGWCEQANSGAEAGLRLAYALKPYWLNRGLLGLGYRVTHEALARADAQSRTISRCGGLADAGQLAFFLGRYSEAQALLEESLAIARELGDKVRIEAVLQPLGMACLGQGNEMAARGHLEEAIGIARELGNNRELAGGSNALAQLHRMAGDLDQAEVLYDEVVTLARHIGDGEIVAIGLLNLAMVSVDRGSSGRARVLLLEVLTIAGAIGSKPAVQSVLEVSAGLAMFREEWGNAALFFGLAEALAAQTGLQRDPADEAFLGPRMSKVREMLGPEAFADAKAAGNGFDYDSALTRVRGWLEGVS